jgi:hypothetical protein
MQSGARLSPGSRHDCPRPAGAGEEAEGRAGWGDGCADLCTRQGRGRPLPVSPTPMAIATTVHGMRTCLREKVELGDKAGSGTNLVQG